MRVEIVRVNKNLQPPRFTDFVYEAAVEERRAPDGEALVSVRALDAESAHVRYALVGGGSSLGFFEIDATSGAVRRTAALDVSRAREHWLVVRAIDDDAASPLSSHAHIYVRVQPVNAFRPLFASPALFVAVAENSEPSKVIVRLNATDRDASPAGDAPPSEHLTYRIVDGNSQSHFSFDESSGYLTTGTRALDRERVAEHELRVEACDWSERQRQCARALVVVTVLDVSRYFRLQQPVSRLPACRSTIVCRSSKARSTERCRRVESAFSRAFLLTMPTTMDQTRRSSTR